MLGWSEGFGGIGGKGGDPPPLVYPTPCTPHPSHTKACTHTHTHTHTLTPTHTHTHSRTHAHTRTSHHLATSLHLTTSPPHFTSPPHRRHWPIGHQFTMGSFLLNGPVFVNVYVCACICAYVFDRLPVFATQCDCVHELMQQPYNLPTA
jgi:hypothetical protein